MHTVIWVGLCSRLRLSDYCTCADGRTNKILNLYMFTSAITAIHITMARLITVEAYRVFSYVYITSYNYNQFIYSVANHFQRLQISAPSSLIAHTLRMFPILSFSTESDRNVSSLTHSATSSLAIPVGQLGLTLINNQETVQ